MAQTSQPIDPATLDSSQVLEGDLLHSAVPSGNVLSNGRMTAFVLSTGATRLTFDGLAINRWRRQMAHGPGTSLIYVRDVESGEAWIVGEDATRVVMQPGGVAYERKLSDDLSSRLEVFVAVEHDMEVRRLTLRNTGAEKRRLEVISYVEIVLGPHAADIGHPAFSKLFVQTSFDRDTDSIRAWRRLRSPDERPAHLLHTCRGDGDPTGFETSRSGFAGRGRDLSDARALDASGARDGSQGSVLDPIASLRRAVDVYPGDAATMTFFTAAAREKSRIDGLLASIDGFEVETEHRAALGSEIERQLVAHIDAKQARYFRALATGLFVDDPRLRAPVVLIDRIDAPASRLDALGVDRSLPLLVARVSGEEDLPVVRTLLKAHGYWRQLGLSTNLFILNDISETEHAERLQAAIEKATDASHAPVHVRGGVFSEYADDMLASDQVLLQGHASIVIREQLPSLKNPVSRRRPIRRFAAPPPDPARCVKLPAIELMCGNGFGGFADDGREYVIDVPFTRGRHVLPPQPWSNVIANPSFGCVVTETGGGYTWARNSRENRITPWFNDSVSDPAGEMILLLDEESGEAWNLMPGRVAAPTDYRVRHGFGHTIFESRFDGLHQRVTVSVDREAPVRLDRVEITNESGRERTLRIVGARSLVLGADEEASPRTLSTEILPKAGGVVVRNGSNGEFRESRVVSAMVSDDAEVRHRLTDRFEPALLAAEYEENDDERGGVVVHEARIRVATNETAQLALLLADADDDDGARKVSRRFADTEAWRRSLDDTRDYWRDLVGGVQISTPSRAIDLMVNGWLPYQNLSCRIWGRSAFYQSGGAFGYRDQLQDAAAMLPLDPDITRRQILLHAEQQFPDGDVMHWWHPPTGKGIRTRFSDDLLWLPYVTATYVRATGDHSVLEVKTSFIDARMLDAGEDEAFVYPERMDRVATVYEHCCLAIDRSMTRGAHGLPLMGTGDWNDGMNRVGRLGQGESVWLGFFIATIIDAMLPICEARGDTRRVESYRNYREHLQRQLNETGWDGAWYRRAFYDNGDALGSSESDEGKIDALAQAWAVISGVAPPERADAALDAMERELVDEEHKIIRLLTPAFDRTTNDPGYIKGYVPGVRENGGQYTHAALWAVRALAEAGRRERAARLLEMLSPVSHSSDRESAERYRVEPYVIAADVYGESPHVGRGGWTWYTGSAGWMYRVALESILGLRIVDGEWLELDPVIPSDWQGFSATYRIPGDRTLYRVEVVNGSLTRSLTVDGEPIDLTATVARIPIRRDGQVHHVIANL